MAAECSPDAWICDALHWVGVHGSAAHTAEPLLRGLLRVVVIVAVGVVVARIGSRLAQRSVETVASRSALADRSPRAKLRAKTLSGVVGSAVRVLVWTGVVLTVFSNVGPLLAGASIAGVAIGFGAQSLVKDFFSGFFVLLEDQYGVGDQVTLGDVSGTVEEVSLRVTRLRATDGTVWFVPNGEIRKVGNAAKDWSRAIVDITISAAADLASATAAIADEISRLGDDDAWAASLLEPPEVLGVEDMGADSVVVRVAAKTVPAQRAMVAREIRARVGARLQREGVAAAKAPVPPPAGGATGAGGAGQEDRGSEAWFGASDPAPGDNRDPLSD